jgi:oligoribonuclease (3'-5' exoribonuclease)
MIGEPKFVFLDIETSGLDPDSDVILEWGMIITDRDLNMIKGFNEVVNWQLITHEDDGSFQPPFGVNKIVTDMHTKNNLWRESYYSTHSVWNAIRNATAGIEKFTPILSDSIGSFYGVSTLNF